MIVDLIGSFWPFIIASAGALWGVIANTQQKRAKAEAEAYKKDAVHERAMRITQDKQHQSTKKGLIEAKKIIQEAHEKNSIADLTRTDY